VAPDLVATVAHVVVGAHSIVLTAGDTSVPGTVVGLDVAREVALVRADRPFPATAHVFSFAAEQPPVGAQVGALGFPLDLGLSFYPVQVAGLNRSLDVAGLARPSPSGTSGGSRLTGLIQVSGELYRGGSGGPLVQGDGRVVGLVEARATAAEGTGYAVPAAAAAPLVAAWAASPRPRDVSGDCSDPVGPSDAGDVPVSDLSGSAQGPAVVRLLGRYAGAINTGDYRRAWQLRTSRVQRGDYEQFAAAERSSLIFDLVLHRVTPRPDGALGAAVTFTTVQDASLGPDGDQSCSFWTLNYVLVVEGGQLRIDSGTGDRPTRC
jgi:S1-C subfamily serine protease